MIKDGVKEASILAYFLLKISHKIFLLNCLGESNSYFSVFCHKTEDAYLESNKSCHKAKEVYLKSNSSTLKQMHYNNIIQTIFISQPINSECFLMASHIIYLYCACLKNMWLRMMEWYLFYFCLLHHTRKYSLTSFK